MYSAVGSLVLVTSTLQHTSLIITRKEKLVMAICMLPLS